jgi:hypothetical protein
VKNPHIVIGDGRRCLCGVYRPDEHVRCEDVIKSLRRIRATLLNGHNPRYEEDIARIERVIAPLIMECNVE